MGSCASITEPWIEENETPNYQKNANRKQNKKNE